MPFYTQTKLLHVSYDLEELHLINSKLGSIKDIMELHAKTLTITVGDINEIVNIQVFPIEVLDISQSEPSALLVLSGIHTLKTVIISEKMKALPGYK